MLVLRLLRTLRTAASGLAIVASAAMAQAPLGTPAPHARTSPPPALQRSTAHGVHEHEGALLGVGPHYRVQFGARGIEFLPALGRQAPRAEPFAVQLLSVQRGMDTVFTAAPHPPERQHDRRSTSYHWPGLTERYETTPAGLEQSFLLHERPQGRGDLRVQCQVTTRLQAATDGALAWRTATGGGVTLGPVLGIAADGQRCPGTARGTVQGYELILPEWFVEQASYPLLVDPLLGTAVEALANADCDFPDCAYDAYADAYCVVWTQFFGGGVTGVAAGVWDAGTLGFAYAFAVNQQGSQAEVRVTHIAGSGVFVLVWVQTVGQGNRISGLAFEPLQTQATPVWNLTGLGSVQSPVLSGEATTQGDQCLVAWLDGTYGLIGCAVGVDNQFQVSATQLVQFAAGNATEPAFSKQGGVPGLHLLVWIDRPAGLPGWVRGQVVDHAGQRVGTSAWLRTGTQDCGYPCLDGDGQRFLVAWEEQELANPSSTDLRGRLLTVGAAGITSQGGVQDFAAQPGLGEGAGDLALLGDGFGLAYQTLVPGPAFGDDVYFRALSRTGAPIGAPLRCDLTPGTEYRYEHAPRLIGCRDGDPATSLVDGLLVFADQSVSSADSDVGLQVVAAVGPGGPVVDLGGGCGPGGLLTTQGPCALGNPAFRVELFGAAPLAIPFLLLALAGPHQNCGACTWLQPLSCAFVANSAGYATASLALPGSAAYVGLAFDVQMVTFQVNYVGCPWAPGAAASNIVRATLDY